MTVPRARAGREILQGTEVSTGYGTLNEHVDWWVSPRDLVTHTPSRDIFPPGSPRALVSERGVDHYPRAQEVISTPDCQGDRLLGREAAEMKDVYLVPHAHPN